METKALTCGQIAWKHLREVLRFQLYFAGKSNVAQVKLMLSLSMHEIMWYALGMVKFLSTRHGVVLRNPRTMTTSPLILLSGGYSAPRVTCSSRSPALLGTLR